MQATLQRLFHLSKNNRTLTLSIWVVIFSASIYLARAGTDEFALFLENIAILLVSLCVLIVPIIGTVIGTVAVLIGLLIYKVIRHVFDKNHSFVPLLLLIGCTALAFMLPLPPLAEEASFIKYQEDYEYVVALAKANQLKHRNGCLADTAFEVPKGFEHLSERCIFVYDYSGNINVQFSPYIFSVSLNYFEFPDDVTKSRDCEFRGGVLKKINENWYVCDQAHTW